MKQNRLAIQEIQSTIINLHCRRPFMLAQTLAIIYEVDVKYINRAVKRNPKRFPADFCFQLTDVEWENLRSQIGTSSCDESDLRCQNGTSSHGGIRYVPYVFTREGANQLSTVLHSSVAIERSIQIMRAFSEMERRTLAEQERKNRAAVRQAQLDWQANRQIVREQRKEMTDAIKALVEYARKQGSTSPEKVFYMSYSKMVSHALFELATKTPPNFRDMLSIKQLQILYVAEGIIEQVIHEEIAKGTPYKGNDGIYAIIKARVTAYALTVGRAPLLITPDVELIAAHSTLTQHANMQPNTNAPVSRASQRTASHN